METIIGILEDNDSIREVLGRYLALEGWAVREFPRIRDLEDHLSSRSGIPGMDLLIMDVMLPDGDGFLAAQDLKRRFPRLPFLFLTARAEESDRITGLEMGAEDYITKPFSNREAVLRVRGLLRRLEKEQPAKDPSWLLGGECLRWSQATKEAYLGDEKLTLTPAEWSLLVYLSTQAPQVLSRAQILEHCLQSIAPGSERTVDTHVKNLRQKLGNQEWIETLRSFGYRFCGVRG